MTNEGISAIEKSCSSSGEDDDWELDLHPLEPVDIVHNNGYLHDDGMIEDICLHFL